MLSKDPSFGDYSNNMKNINTMESFTFTPELNMVMAVVVRTKAFVSGLLSITL